MFINSSYVVLILFYVWDVDVFDGYYWMIWCVYGLVVYLDGKGCNGVYVLYNIVCMIIDKKI